MIALLQRVATARVEVDGRVVGEIGRGLLVFLAVERGDREAQAERLIERVLNYRVFPDDAGRMNLSVLDATGEVLLVSQFTLAADTRSGLRPSFTPAAEPAEARRLFDYALARARTAPLRVETGRFGADMQIALVNDGPVTLSLRAAPDN
ncbi:MAG: D-tyrosyl-tRNA(Tyr) deacylase [Gammaproteobacteria bacterium]|nr:D-tyrosyl-tRNA(Tyr) deacylase [Gammaproteobacteria bacterium]